MRITDLSGYTVLPVLAFPGPAHAAQHLHFAGDGLGLGAIALFVVAYVLVVTEEWTRLRKSTPVLVAAGLIWVLVALAARQQQAQDLLAASARESLLDYAELLLFLMVAMTYVNAMTDRQVFAAMRRWLIGRRLGLRALFWISGLLAFFLSAVIDNLTTSLVMGALVIGMSSDRRFLVLSCINIVVAANAGGAWCAFGDVTSLMVWQAGRLEFFEFFRLLVPSAVAWLIPAACMHPSLPRHLPLEQSMHTGGLRPGGAGVVALFGLTLATAVSLQNLVGLPPVMGMMLGLGYLKAYGYFLRGQGAGGVGDQTPFDVFGYIARVEWDTLLFFYGVILCVGGLAALGYMAVLADLSYARLGPTVANVMVGIVSAVVDNIPVMAAVLEMNPPMSQGQWLLVTLSAGIGGSLLSVGSAAGVALMGQARGFYTFFSHLWWTPAIALGYAAAIWTHLLVNRALF
ncbi:MAG: sodium:proton antiporter NhaD [Gammaproteobacteria bacterium]|nr:sodium:proton antiporter NhaD [Gammaproteobacteria bacterium]